MLFKLCKRWFQDRRASTAIVVAITLVPMMIAGVTAVDMARISAARTVLQGAVDAAAIAGGGAWNTNGSATAAASTARATYAGATATLGAMTASLTASTASSLVSTYCNTSSTTASCGTATADTTGSCPSSGSTPSYQYCIVVQASLSVNNLLMGWILPTTGLTAKAVDTVGTASYNVNAGDFSSTSVGSAYDTNNILAYVVPTTSSGAADFATVPTANSSCTTGVIADESNKTTVSSSTACNYELIGSSTGGSASGSLDFSSGQYISFAFANLMGGTQHFGADGTYQYQTNITVSSSASSSGTSYTYGACAYGSNIVKLTSSTSSCSNGYTRLYGECPQHNLYGSITQGTTGSLVTNNASDADSLTVYSSSYEMLGYPPTHNVNHTLPSFTDTISESVGGGYGGGTTYYVTMTCPAWPTSATQTYVPVDTDITAYSTYYPDTTYPYPSTSSAVYPPNLQSACSPAASYPTVGSTTTTNAWWGWSQPNTATGSPATNNCTNQPTTTSGSYDPAYNNCALVIQPLGDAVPTSNSAPELPSYYVEVMTTNSSSATPILLDPVYDNATFTDIYPGVLTLIHSYDSSITVSSVSTTTLAATLVSSHASNYYPTGTTHWQITSGTYSGDYAYIVKPAQNSSGGYTNSLPPATSSRCYNPQQNGFSSTYFTDSNNNDGASIDYIANPEYGAIDCSKYSGYSFGLYWNDMGGSASDDLGYWNAVTVFTCPTPTYTSGASAPSTLSG